jgi:hypothetical protein
MRHLALKIRACGDGENLGKKPPAISHDYRILPVPCRGALTLYGPPIDAVLPARLMKQPL